MSKPGHPTSIRLQRELKAALQKEADDNGWKLAALITRILDQWVKWRRKEAKKKNDKG